jgi:two-component system sensor histidine kinase SenX3
VGLSATVLVRAGSTPAAIAAVPIPGAELRKAAHDIRTPLATIVLSVEAILDLSDETSERARNLFDVLRRNVLWMGQVLDSSMGRATDAFYDVNLVSLASDVCDLVRPLLAARGQSLVVLPQKPILMVRGDYAMLARALLNLLENASKYGPDEDQIRVILRHRSASTLVTVCDHGLGIPRRERSAVFESSYRTVAARTSERGGYGLGLGVVREVVRRHGGSVGIRRAQGETRMWFCIPDEKPTNPDLG